MILEPTTGEIHIGQPSINNLSLQSWRSQIGYVFQDSEMMARTIKENLCYGLPRSCQISNEHCGKLRKWPTLMILFTLSLKKVYIQKLEYVELNFREGNDKELQLHMLQRS